MEKNEEIEKINVDGIEHVVFSLTKNWLDTLIKKYDRYYPKSFCRRVIAKSVKEPKITLKELKEWSDDKIKNFFKEYINTSIYNYDLTDDFSFSDIKNTILDIEEEIHYYDTIKIARESGAIGLENSLIKQIKGHQKATSSMLDNIYPASLLSMDTGALGILKESEIKRTISVMENFTKDLTSVSKNFGAIGATNLFLRRNIKENFNIGAANVINEMLDNYINKLSSNLINLGAIGATNIINEIDSSYKIKGFDYLNEIMKNIDYSFLKNIEFEVIYSLDDIRNRDIYKKSIQKEKDSMYLLTYDEEGDINLEITTQPYDLFVPNKQDIYVNKPGLIKLNCKLLGFSPSAIEEFEYLLNDPNVKEKHFQEFFENNSIFQSIFNFENLYPQVLLKREDDNDLKPDFILTDIRIPRSMIIDLKRPQDKLVVRITNKTKLSEEVTKVKAQLENYHDWFDEEKNRLKLKGYFGIEIYKPVLCAIIGRSSDFINCYDRQQLLSRESRIKIYTFDDMLEFIKRKIHNAVNILKN